MELADQLFTHVKKRSINMQNDIEFQWYMDLKKIVTNNECSISQLEEVIDFVCNDSFWGKPGLITGVAGLRRNIEKILLKVKDNPVYKSKEEKAYFKKVKDMKKIPLKSDISVKRVSHQFESVKVIPSIDQDILFVVVRLQECLNQYLKAQNYKIILNEDVINWDEGIRPLFESGNSKDTLIRVIDYIEQYSSWIELIYNANDFRVLYPEILKEMNNKFC
jgi:hypothetical protein